MDVSRKPTEVVQVNLRIKESLRRRLERAAMASGSSLNAEMIERLEKSFQNEDLRPKLDNLTEIIHAITAKHAREGRVLAGFISDELSKRGLDEADAKELTDVIRAYLGPQGIEKTTTQQRLQSCANTPARKKA
jgi:hypothetical protein